MSKYSKFVKQVLFFIVIGVVTLLIDIGVSAVCYYMIHMPAYLASGIGFLSGFFFNFPMNRKRVFSHSIHDRFRLHTQVALYVVLCLFNLVTTSLLVDLMVNSHIVPIQYAKILVTGLIAVWNFLLFKFFIFSKKEQIEREVTKD